MMPKNVADGLERCSDLKKMDSVGMSKAVRTVKREC